MGPDKGVAAIIVMPRHRRAGCGCGSGAVRNCVRDADE
jgi:hypothetical protein